MGAIMQKVRYALRVLRKSPGFTAVTVITLALGIGANTAMFSIVDTVLFKPLPFPEPDRLVSFSELISAPGRAVIEGGVSYPDLFDWRSGSRSIEAMASYHSDDFTLTSSGEPIHLSGQTVSSNLFSVLRVPVFIGRGFSSEDDKLGMRTVILSYKLWQSRFGGNRNIVGRNITLNQQSYLVAGIMPAGFSFPIQTDAPQIWRSMAADSEAAPGDLPATARRSYHLLSVVGRLAPGISLQQARQEMNQKAAALAAEYPDTNAQRRSVRVVTVLEDLVGERRPALLIMLSSVACVLLIACVNVTNLLLMRGYGRSKEIAIRTALGSSRARIVWQLLTENFVLAIAGAALGVVPAASALRFVSKLNLEDLPRLKEVGLDPRMLGITVAIAIFTTLMFGLMPAIRSSAPALTQSLKESGRSVTGGKTHVRLRSALVIAEIAVSVVVMVASGLLLRSFIRLLDVDPGFHPDNVMTFSVDLSDPKYKNTELVRFHDDVLSQLRTFPGVKSAAGIWPLPLSSDYARVSVEIERHPAAPGEDSTADLRIVSPGYFRTLRIPLIEGRDFTAHDNMNASDVVIVNKAFAQRYFPNEDPIGEHVTPGLDIRGKRPARVIVGVVGNVKHRALNADFTPEYYLPYTQVPARLNICLSTAGDPHGTISAVRKIMASVDPNVAVYNIRMLQDYVTVSLSPSRYRTILLGGFSALALVLTAIGLYGTIGYGVSHRTHEIGIRMSMGATRYDIMYMILKSSLQLTLAGIGIGLVNALILNRAFPAVTGLLFGVSATDILTFLSVVLILLFVSLLAGYLPARRATAVDPTIALRSE